MNIAKIIAFISLLAMTIVLIYGFVIGDFAGEGAQLLQMPWGIVSLVDLYTGFVLFSGWIIYREKRLPTAIAWVIAMMVTGFWAGSLYALLALQRSQGGWKRFWLGKHA